ncbi:MutT/nudix family protein [Alteracholeplasma palmae J233]|uniref:MutT/nudix family protein n=1 Tax=Alteracholeplasma palmae (strain ATCC 49389 / J233) TaxID=1318466 RepID=U4KQV2_ALTPJ|nr:NUDIX domain-containing protein [Alteracholeplasma palmae]CCV63626.1 MutT/nudix family protein [Alteracholeplasma palmae J233]
MNKNYIKWIRSKVGHEKIFLNFVGGCIRNSKGEILLQRRKDKNVWGFPGGAIELGESAKEAVIREIKEETGLDIIPRKMIGVYTHYFDEYPNGDSAQVIAIFFDLEIVGGKLDDNNDETLELKFFNETKCPKLVNQQHEDALIDMINREYGICR